MNVNIIPQVCLDENKPTITDYIGKLESQNPSEFQVREAFNEILFRFEEKAILDHKNTILKAIHKPEAWLDSILAIKKKTKNKYPVLWGEYTLDLLNRKFWVELNSSGVATIGFYQKKSEVTEAGIHVSSNQEEALTVAIGSFHSRFPEIPRMAFNREGLLLLKDDGKPVFSLKFWMAHRKHRTVTYSKFVPQSKKRFMKNKDGTWTRNLWTGPAFEAKKGDCSLMLKMVEEVLCDGKEELYGYLINYFALLVQKPYFLPKVCVELKSADEGVGKGVWTDVFYEYFGTAATKLSSSGLAEKFNEWALGKVLLLGNEAVFSGDPQAAGRLKPLITDPSIPIRGMQKVSRDERNFATIIQMTNENRSIAVQPNDRRYLVIKCGPKRENSYYKKIIDERDSGGKEALIYYLKNEISLKNYDPRNRPQTVATFEETLENAGSVGQFVYEILSNLCLPIYVDRSSEKVSIEFSLGEEFIQPKSMLFERYKAFCFSNKSYKVENKFSFNVNFEKFTGAIEKPKWFEGATARCFIHPNGVPGMRDHFGNVFNVSKIESFWDTEKAITEPGVKTNMNKREDGPPY